MYKTWPRTLTNVVFIDMRHLFPIYDHKQCKKLFFFKRLSVVNGKCNHWNLSLRGTIWVLNRDIAGF